MADEMYLDKGTQHQAGKYVGADCKGRLFKGIVAFMIVGLKESVPIIIRASPEITISGEWLANEFSTCITHLIEAGFTVRAIVTDNHSANVSAFKKLLNMYESQDELSVKFPGLTTKIYLFFDTVHLLKNIWNNLFNNKKFVFPEFNFVIGGNIISSPPGYVSWSDLHDIYDKDEHSPANLRKAYKLTYKALHPGNNKQNVDLALAIFHETTIAACQSYLPQRKDMSSFLLLILQWWTIANSKKRFTPNVMGNGIVTGDGKTAFFIEFAAWLETWSSSPSFGLSKQTSNALIRTLKAQAMLIDELLNNGYDYVLMRKLQSDPLEKRFSQYRQMSGGRFLVSLREVISSERILICRSLIKANVNFWEEDLQEDNSFDKVTLLNGLMNCGTDIMDLSLSHESEEVAYTIAGYVAKKLSKRSKCETCKTVLGESNIDDQRNKYMLLLSRGGLTVPSSVTADFVCQSFAILDFADAYIEKQFEISTRAAAEFILHSFAPNLVFTCTEHISWGWKFAIRIVVNVFYNNKQKITSDSVRKSAVHSFKTRQRTKDM